MTMSNVQRQTLGEILTETNKKYGRVETKEALQLANIIKQQWTSGGLMTLGASKFRVSNDGLGGLIFEAIISPLKKNGERSNRPETMVVYTEYTPVDDYKVTVINKKGEIHFQKEEVYCSDLQRLALALDFNGAEVLNPRYT